MSLFNENLLNLVRMTITELWRNNYPEAAVQSEEALFSLSEQLDQSAQVKKGFPVHIRDLAKLFTLGTYDYAEECWGKTPGGINSLCQNVKEYHKKILNMLNHVYAQEPGPLSQMEESLLMSCLKKTEVPELLENFPLFEACIAKKRSSKIYPYMMNYFKKDIPCFLKWIDSPSRYLEIPTSLSEQLDQSAQVNNGLPAHIRDLAKLFTFGTYDYTEGLWGKTPGGTTSVCQNVKEYHKKILDMLNHVYAQEPGPLSQMEENLLMSCLKKAGGPELLENFPLFEACIAKKRSSKIYPYMMNYFKKDIPCFLKWIDSPCRYLEIPKEQQDENHRYLPNSAHAFDNKEFAQSILQNIPPECWTLRLLQTVGGWGISDFVDEEYTRRFARVIDKASDTNIASFFSAFSERVNYPDLREYLSAKKFIILANSLQKETSRKGMSALISAMDDDNWKKICANLNSETAQQFVSMLLLTDKGMERALDVQVPKGKPVLWSLYEKGLLNDYISKIISKAIESDKIDFLTARKNVHFSEKSPYYEDLKKYFKEKSSARGMEFLKSFSWNGVPKEDHYNIIQDFIDSSSIQKYSFKALKVFNSWASSGSSVKMFSTCYGDDYETEQNPQLKISYKDFYDLWTGVDEKGKTPWHYICSDDCICLNKKNQIFFNEKYEEVLKTLLDVAGVKDKQGNTPLKYLSQYPRFLATLVEKIPELSSKLQEQGIQFTHVPPKKEKVKSVPSVKLAPGIPNLQKEIEGNTPLEQQKLIEEAIHTALENNENLILRGKERTFGFANSVLQGIEEDSYYKQDIVEHLQQFLSTPYIENFTMGGQVRWKRFKREEKEAVYEMSFSPSSGNAQSMPRLYARKWVFKQDGSKWSIASKKEAKNKKSLTSGVWVSVVKGDKRDQANDSSKSKHIFFKNDGLKRPDIYSENSLDWLFKDVYKKDGRPARQISPNVLPGGRG